MTPVQILIAFGRKLESLGNSSRVPFNCLVINESFQGRRGSWRH